MHRFLLIAVGLLAGCDRDTLHAALATGRLAPLPASARAVAVRTEGNLFSRSFWVRFEAAPEDIDRFLAASPGLAGRRAGRLCAREALGLPPHLTTPLPGSALLFVSAGRGCEPRTLRLPGDGAAFDPGTPRAARVYEIPQDSEANDGTVVVDDARHQVFVWTSHS